MCQKEVWSAFREEGWGGSRGCLLGSREVRAARVSGHRQEKGLERWQGQTRQPPHFTEGETEAQRGKVACPRSYQGYVEAQVCFKAKDLSPTPPPPRKSWAGEAMPLPRRDGRLTGVITGHKSDLTPTGVSVSQGGRAGPDSSGDSCGDMGIQSPGRTSKGI